MSKLIEIIGSPGSGKRLYATNQLIKNNKQFFFIAVIGKL